MPDLTTKPYTPYGASRKVWESQEKEVLIPGPAGTGKTRGNLEKLHLACLKYPGCRVCLIRKTRKSLTQSVLVTLENQVFTPDWRRWFGNAQRDHRSNYHYPNGSEMVPCGMDDPQKIMSSEWDRAGLFESIEFTE
jgi:phage terminase large subunit